MFTFKATIVVLALATGQPVGVITMKGPADNIAKCYAVAEQVTARIHAKVPEAAFVVKCEKDGPKL